MGHTSSLAPARAGSSQKYFHPGTALHRLLLEAPFLPRCSDDKTATRIRPVEYAIQYPYMQVNRAGRVSWLIFDLDHANAGIWEDAGLPAPNLIVRNRESGHSHVYYAIEPVCTTSKGRSKPIEYMRAVYAEMATRLKADPAYFSGPVAKTPGHPWWATTELHPHEYQLGKLADYIELPRHTPWSKGPGPGLEAAADSRHCTLFELLRHYAYSIVRRERAEGSFEHFVSVLEAFCLNNNGRVTQMTNSARGELSWSSLKATVRSVSRWTWDRYTGKGDCHRGVMALDKSLSLAERQRLAAARTHALRQKATESKIRAACRQLRGASEALAQSAIARLAGVTRQTVASYKHVLAEGLLPAVAKLQVAAVTVVKFAVHQVSAARSSRLRPSPQLDLFKAEGGFSPEPAS